MDDIKVNDIIEATVSGIQKYGAFVLINDKYDDVYNNYPLSTIYYQLN